MHKGYQPRINSVKLKSHKLPGVKFKDNRLKAGGRTIRSDIHKYINSIWSKEELAEECKE
jgi:hypothetical protein